MNLREELAMAERRAGAVASRLRAAAEEAATARVRVTVADGDVTVVVDGNGTLLEIDLARQSARRHRHTLGAHVVAAVTKARHQALAESRSVLADFMREKEDPGTPPGRGSPAAAPGDNDETDVYFQGLYSDGHLR